MFESTRYKDFLSLRYRVRSLYSFNTVFILNITSVNKIVSQFIVLKKVWISLNPF